MQKEKNYVEVVVKDDTYLGILGLINDNNKMDGSFKCCEKCHKTDDDKVASFLFTAIQLLTKEIDKENEELRKKQQK